MIPVFPPWAWPLIFGPDGRGRSRRRGSRIVRRGRVFELHATKGWRSYRDTKARP